MRFLMQWTQWEYQFYYQKQNNQDVIEPKILITAAPRRIFKKSVDDNFLSFYAQKKYLGAYKKSRLNSPLSHEVLVNKNSKQQMYFHPIIGL